MMYSFFDSLFWMHFVYSLVVLFFAFFIPGDLLVRRLTLSFFQRVILATTLGICLWIFQGITFGYLQARFLTYFYLLGTFILWVKTGAASQVLQAFRKENLKHIDIMLAGILLLGVSIQVLSMFFIGVVRSGALTFCCFWPDSFYHLALTNQLVHSFPPYEPGASGVIAHNYHYLSNLVVAELVRVFHLPLINLQYQYMGIFLSFLFGCSAIVFGQIFNIGRAFTRWLVFFLFFSGDIIFILLFFLGHGLNFSLNISENATTLWFSPSRVFALTVIFSGLAFLLLWLKKKDTYTGVLVAVTLGILIGLKVYIGIFALSGLAFLTFYFFLKKDFQKLFVFPLAALISLLLYFPVNKGAGGLIFVGMWRFEDFAVRPILNLLQVENARRVYMEHSSYPRIFLIEVFYVLLYIYSLCGMFLIGLFQSKKSLSLFPKELHIFLLSGFLLSLIAGLFFIQSTGGANTLQFLFMVYIVGAVYAALALTHWSSKIKGILKVVFILLIIVLTGARVAREVYFNIDNLIQQKGFFTVNQKEVDALRFVRDKTPGDAILLVERDLALENICYYLSFLSNRQLYLCGNGILLDHGIDISQKEGVLDAVFVGKDKTVAREVIISNNTHYVYIKSKSDFLKTHNYDFLYPVFQNEEVTIMKVK